MEKHSVSVRHAQGPSEEEREEIRPTFETLYLVRNRSLHEVMQVIGDRFALQIT